MGRFNKWILTAVAWLTALGSGTEAVAGSPAEPPPPARSANLLAMDLYRHLIEPEGNLFFSPASISMALAMAWSGARGQTAAEMSETLHLQGEPAEVVAGFGKLLGRLDRPGAPYTLRLANRLWGQQDLAFHAAFLEPLQNDLRAPLEQLDFKGSADPSRLVINDWVAEQTEQKILDLLPPGSIDRNTSLVLTNAVYFLADWQSPFKDFRTKPQAFRRLDGSEVEVPLMDQTHEFPYQETEDLQVVALPYKGGELEMVILLPRASGDLLDLEKSLTLTLLEEWLANLDQRTVICQIPRFTLTAEFKLNQVLGAMGMPTAFDFQRADFSGMTDQAKLFISAVMHKAFIEVDEKGTEAAAATGVVMGVTSAMPPPRDPVVFRADHPFLYLIRHKETGSILFMGRMVDPEG